MVGIAGFFYVMGLVTGILWMTWGDDEEELSCYAGYGENGDTCDMCDHVEGLVHVGEVRLCRECLDRW